MTIDVQLCDVGQSLLESGQLTTISPSELALGLGAGSSGALEQPLSATLSPAGSLQDEDMEDFKVRRNSWTKRPSLSCLSLNLRLNFKLFF